MTSFLSPLLHDDPNKYVLRNERTGTVIADCLLTAFDSRSRRTGLLRHESLPSGTALIIAPTNAIHTFFMKFPIDVIFAAKDGTIVKVRPALGPWGIAVALRGHAVIEMMAGTLNVAEIRKGDRVLVGRTAAGVRDSAT